MLRGFVIYAVCYYFALLILILRFIWGSELCEFPIDSNCFADKQRATIDLAAYTITVSSLYLFFFCRSLIDPIINITTDMKLRAVMKKDLRAI